MESTVSKKADLYQRNNRVRYVDIARGISIICIILGHLGVSSINRFVFTFHVPVFFLISGYFFDEKSNWKVFTGKKVKTLFWLLNNLQLSKRYFFMHKSLFLNCFIKKFTRTYNFIL